MSYFADLTPYEYSARFLPRGATALNVGGLDEHGPSWIGDDGSVLPAAADCAPAVGESMVTTSTHVGDGS
jgi:hypothetical protein